MTQTLGKWLPVQGCAWKPKYGTSGFIPYIGTLKLLLSIDTVFLFQFNVMALTSKDVIKLPGVFVKYTHSTKSAIE
jgi:hypothetical protein